MISVTGAGGKTSLMMSLAEKLPGPVLVTTSTKIAVPDEEGLTLYTREEDYPGKAEGIVCIGNRISEKKLSAISEEKLREIGRDFRHIVIEADGCRNLPIKMWKDHEPVIYDGTDLVVGVFSVKVFGKTISDDIMYYTEGLPDRFTEIDEELLAFLIDNGLFRNFFGPRYIFINQTDTEEEKKTARRTIRELQPRFPEIHFFYGSVLKDEFYEM